MSEIGFKIQRLPSGGYVVHDDEGNALVATTTLPEAFGHMGAMLREVFKEAPIAPERTVELPVALPARRATVAPAIPDVDLQLPRANGNGATGTLRDALSAMGPPLAALAFGILVGWPFGA